MFQKSYLEVYGTKNFRFANPRQAREPCLRLCDLCETGGPILGFHGDFLQPETQGIGKDVPRAQRTPMGNPYISPI